MNETPVRGKWRGLSVLALAQLMITLDGTIVTIALPSTQTALGMSDVDRAWVITAYALTLGSGLLLGGRVADRYGRRRTLVIGLIGFAIASGLGGAAAGGGMLIAARAAQGVFAAILSPSTLSLLVTVYTGVCDRARALGVFSAVTGGGAGAGLLLGGVLTEYLDWRWCLYVNVPIALCAVLGALRYLPDPPGHRETAIDLPGAVLACAGFAALTYAFAEGTPKGWGSWEVLVIAAAAVGLLAAFVILQARSRNPLLPLRIVTERNRAGSFLALGLTTFATFGISLFATFQLQDIMHYSPLMTGVAILPMVATVFIASSQVASRLMPRLSPRALLVPGIVLTGAAMLVLTRLTPTTSYAAGLLPAQILLGLGMALITAPATGGVMSSVHPRDTGLVSAVMGTSRQLGGAIGAALANAVATAATSAYLVSSHDSVAARVHGYAVASAWGAGIVILGALVVAVLANAGPPRAGSVVEPRSPAQDTTAVDRTT
ncbi:MFS transporter [Actinophytocola oryzae]|uniref:EmrB/QacA subfamily drug resistance transporter n=1 Tax=Actinophytocola oryzae TaxID=502181 RepID=A0A4R7UNA3_9PSEU|nr:MFS transporter [Actinophytocola oryzae]TDV34223.1 EmrB/QacA subfamily drug resistance transporter [Actinophytocola oryzae]